MASQAASPGPPAGWALKQPARQPGEKCVVLQLVATTSNNLEGAFSCESR